MRLIFARHGESEANILREISNRGAKHGLTDKGRQQARDLAQALAHVGATRIYCSPLLRAVQTAQILSEALHVGFETTDALREYDLGVLEGRSDPDVWLLYWKLRDDWVLRQRWDSRIEGGESYLDMQARFVPFIENLVDPKRDVGCASGLSSEECIILVGHGGLYACMLPVVLTNIDLAFANSHQLGNSAYVLAELRPEGLVCLEWCGAPIAPRAV